MIVFVDLDGTLTHTADVKYKEFKDGLRDFNPTQIPLFHGSVDFISTLKIKDIELLSCLILIPNMYVLLLNHRT